MIHLGLSPRLLPLLRLGALAIATMLVHALLAPHAAAQATSAQTAAPAMPHPLVIGPLVIGHRGTAGHLPEHTIAGYTLAIDLGADYIEPDLVSTKDGVLIARHENDMSDTTDVAAKFPQRGAEKSIDGRAVRGWFSEDFTLAEIKTLRAKERLPFRDHSHDGQYEVPTLEEIIALAKRKGAERGRPVGIYPETKHPSYFRAIGLSLEEPLLATLERSGLNGADSPVFIQSFEVGNLKVLHGKTPLPLIQLIGSPRSVPPDLAAAGDRRTWGDLITPAGLAEIARYARGIGPEKSLIQPVAPDGSLLPPTSLVQDAHAAGLLVHPYTFRREPYFLPKGYGGDPIAEYKRFYELGVDGVFSDFADDAVKARELMGKK
jgi:glycerophosphoryl diester phosphodiesterase